MRYYFSIILTFLTIAISSLSAQVNFSADKVEGCGLVTAKFTATSAGAIHKTLWDFGNGITSLELSPIHTFALIGQYTVKLTINDSAVAISKNNYIKVRHLPDARFVITDSVTSGPFIYNLYATQQPVDTFIHTYSWTYNWLFSDNSSASSPVVVHQFDTAGVYKASLKITDDIGCVDSFQHVIRVSNKIIVPNVFTPNDDNLNDVLEIQTNGKSHYLFRVFSHSGILVFKLESVFIRWGGENLSGLRLNQGVYYYTLESLDPVNPSTQSGFIYLLR
jgi:gliding motility-associated-like protein